MEYSEYKILFAEKNEPMKDTLIWEFSKNIARLSGYENNPGVIVECCTVVTGKLVDMKLGDLIDEVGEEI